MEGSNWSLDSLIFPDPMVEPLGSNESGIHDVWRYWALPERKWRCQSCHSNKAVRILQWPAETVPSEARTCCCSRCRCSVWRLLTRSKVINFGNKGSYSIIALSKLASNSSRVFPQQSTSTTTVEYVCNDVCTAWNQLFPCKPTRWWYYESFQNRKAILSTQSERNASFSGGYWHSDHFLTLVMWSLFKQNYLPI